MSKTALLSMIRPEQFADAAKRNEKHNMRFRAYLKKHADETELDWCFAIQEFDSLEQEIQY